MATGLKVSSIDNISEQVSTNSKQVYMFHFLSIFLLIINISSFLPLCPHHSKQKELSTSEKQLILKYSPSIRLKPSNIGKKISSRPKKKKLKDIS